MRDPDLRHPGCGGVYAVSDEWLWRRGRERGVRSEGAVASPRQSYVHEEAEAI